MVSNLNTTINSKSYSNKEKIVESAFFIGNNVKWIDQGNIIFQLNNIADIFSGNTYALTNHRDFYQIIYDSFITKRMFSGEVYDDADNYLEKVMNIYFYGCSAIFQCLKNTQLMCNFTDKDIDSLSPVVKYHFENSAVGGPKYVSDQIKYIADKIYDIKNKDSVVSHYLAFKYKKKFCRNIFINLGHTDPVPIANQINIFSYKYYKAYYDINYYQT